MAGATIWPGDAQLAMSFVVNVEEGAEYSPRDGDRHPEPVDELGIALKRPVRSLGNESSYRYGIRAGAPRVLALLDRYRIPATFTAAAVALERAPELARAIAAAGHEVCAHGHRWVHQFSMDEAAEREFIRKAVVSIEKTTGRRPTGWLSRYLFTERTRRLLVEEGFSYHMDDYSDDAPFWDVEAGRAIVVMPYAIDSNDMKMWVAPAFTPEQWLAYAVETFEVLYEEGRGAPRMMSLGVHLRIIGRPGRIRAFERFIQHVRSRPRVWIATRQQMAECWAAANPRPRDAGR
jgi:peptidoglycan/xylan/chitin deacetylase (PgdA/CDA1 family)